MKAIIFARVSSREQEETGYSLDAQEKLLQDYASKKQFEVAKTYKITESASGKQIRTMFNEMLKYATKHKIPVILCEKIDRLTRNLKDAAIINDWLVSDTERSVHFVKESFVVNQNTRAHENFVWDMKVAIARFYTNNLSEEVKKGQKEKIAQGWLPVKPPLGYKTIGEKGHKTHIIDPERAPFIKTMFELYATGNYSVTALVHKIYELGLRNHTGKQIGKSRMYDLLSDPFYYGKICWKGQIYDGKQEPLITRDLFMLVQDKLNRKLSQPQFQTHLPVFKTKIICGECGNTIAWYTKKGHWYGDCKHHRTCSQRGCVRQEAVESQLFTHFGDLLHIGPNELKVLEKSLKECHAGEIEMNTAKRKELNSSFDRIQRRLEGMYEDKLDGKITTEFYENKFSDYSAEKEQILSDLKILDEGNEKYYEAGFAIHELALKAAEIYQSPRATIDQKRLLLSYSFSEVRLRDKQIKLKYTPGFEFLSKWLPLLNEAFEPTFLSKNRAFNPVSATELRR